MYRIDTPDAVREMPAPNPPGPNLNHYFTNGNPRTGQPGTILQADWANTIQDELSNFIEHSGITLNKNSQSQLSDLLQKKADTIESAATVNLGNIAGRFVDITGTTPITSFGLPNKNKNTFRMVRFLSSLVLTYHPENLILPGGQSIATTPGDIAEFYHLGDGKWVCTKYERARTIGFSASRTTPQPFSPGVRRKIEFNETNFNYNNDYDKVTNFRFTPRVAGNYIVTASLSVVSAQRSLPVNAVIFIYLNGSNEYASVYPFDTAADPSHLHPSVTCIIPMNGSTDYLECYGISGLAEASIDGYPVPQISSFFQAIRIS